MNCVECDRPAHGTCRFCGRGLCRDHFESANFIVSVNNGQTKSEEGPEVLVVKNVLKCRHCEPIGELINLNKKD